MRVIILSKAPVNGRVKTRLIPQYTAEQAANLHRQMTYAVLTKVCGMFDDVWLAADDIHHSFFKELQIKFNCELRSQSQGDLGSRLRALSTASFAVDDKSVMFLGTDSPHVQVCRYQEAASALQTHNVVIGPVEDGGYDLIGTSQDYPDIFDCIDWGSSAVFDETVNKTNELELSLKALDLSFDLDRAEDIERAPPHTWHLAS